MKTVVINQIMRKHNCVTPEELEEKRQELYRHFETTRDMVDSAIRNNDIEYANKVGIEMDKFASQVREIEEVMQAE